MPETENLHGANLIDAVYGESPPPLDDPMECYFEASKLHLRALSWDVPGGVALDKSEELRLLTQRAARLNPSRSLIPLPDPAPLQADLADAIDARRSSEAFGAGELPLPVLSGMLERSYRVRLVQGWPRRPVPSGGALYPLDLYVIAQRVEGLRPGLHHYDPFRHGLTWLREVDHEALHLATLQPEMAGDAAAMLVIGASFWRSRFKYGQRSLRFCLLEAGHLGQNLLLLGTAYGLASRPIGGFLDDDFTADMDYDGVNESPLYVVLLGPPAGEGTADRPGPPTA
ncbi:SagB/ThcOx family dehydrogenase [Streptomyces sp. Je 1-4]|uniref:SagB/ThcOx family dehydrogenase n=1 Tax=Streptomyces TaxID=1883 RepID=UPI0021D9AB0F|nr:MULTISPECIES: SagB/ThcOx family dehydrogenase [unclassified Streptomyces]UYB41025.1 SagB/ThcOx family dehydrogenase [Streptomyces sp. Je 1-4]UZQ37187.1 SagB/ThcOx family dehydrogenase [Streptomyces sp. Je 1-4] [Streptomyces sp. Je 1-4 4N24]UZQ44604.1 SagB/ThcOx family dehydrogenase [Streptomyces sp. Je 1-4] [Streptomyces sp. Je 1-4 4N24_ara]